MAQRVDSRKLDLLASDVVEIKAAYTAKSCTITKNSRCAEEILKSDIFPSEINISRSEPVEKSHQMSANID